MKYLFIHPNFPGQYKHIIVKLAESKTNEVLFICDPKKINTPGIKKIQVPFQYKTVPKNHPYVVDFERAVCRGQYTADICNKLKRGGFTPDIICAHPGWGSALFVKDVYPDVPLLNYCEFYYHGVGADVHFYPEDKVTLNKLAYVRSKNANNILNLQACDHAITPTKWQYSVMPKEFKSKITILHEGIDTDNIKPRTINSLKLPNGIKLKKSDEIITYIARNLEPYRGFPTFMKALELLHKARPNCQVIIIGADGTSYGNALFQGKTHRDIWMQKVKIDPKRAHFIGYVPYNEMLNILSISAAHIYLTVPFVLSWSLLESMALESLVIGSATPPVQEVIEDGKNGFLIDFFSPEQIVEKINEVFAHNDQMQDIRKAARKTIEERFSLKNLMPKHLELLDKVAKRIIV